MPLLDIMKIIDAMTVKSQTLYHKYEQKHRDNATLKTSLNRLNFEIQKQSKYLIKALVLLVYFLLIIKLI